MARREFRMADLCSGIGGMSLAFSRAGYRCVFASEIDGAACDVYKANHGFRPAGDLAGVDPRDVPDHEVCVAGLPCQPHSVAGLQLGHHDSRSHVLYDLLRDGTAAHERRRDAQEHRVVLAHQR